MPTINFKGKSFVQNHHLSVPYHQLVPNKKLSLTDKVSLNDNLIIHGDNLLALKALLPTYAGRIKCIYIDPPYNTGKDNWVYNDKVNSPMMKEWLGKVVDKEDLTRHDKWLCMITPRMKLLHELLAEDGVIFISIDDNEVSNLRLVMDEIFIEGNWLGSIVWHNVTDNNPTNIAVEHEYIVSYCKNKELLPTAWKTYLSDIKELLIEVGSKFIIEFGDSKELQKAYQDWFRANKHQLGPLDRYKYIDEGGIYTGSQSVHNPGKGGYRYDVIHPVTKKPCKQPLMGYRFPEETMKKLLNGDKILFGEDEEKIIELKLYVEEYKENLSSVIVLDGRVGAYQLRELFPEVEKIFQNPKPIQLLRQLFSFALGPNEIVLDSFAGSGTTAHAVLSLNEIDGGNRKFILVESEDYADKITAERVRRAIKGVKDAKNESIRNGLGGTFSYFELGEPIVMKEILKGENLPSYEELARYVFYTSTGEEFNALNIKEEKYFIGSTAIYDVYLLYKPDIEYLKTTALNLDIAKEIGLGEKKKIVFAPAKYVDSHSLLELKIEFCQLPFEIYKLKG